MTREDKPSIFGVGPAFVTVLALITATVTCVNYLGYLELGRVQTLRWGWVFVGVVLVVLGFTLWLSAIIGSRFWGEFQQGKLVTTGVYAWVRHPIYAAFLLALSGILIAQANYWMLVFPPLFWGFMSVLMKHTEERWLLEIFGEDYREYCSRTPRCLPFPPRRR